MLLAGTVDVPPSAISGITFAPPSPNPGFGTVTLRFGLPRGASVSLAIFDARGRRVRMLASGPQSEGEHTITWDQRDESGKPAGPAVYFARLETEGRVFVRKLSKSN